MFLVFAIMLFPVDDLIGFSVSFGPIDAIKSTLQILGRSDIELCLKNLEQLHIDKIPEVFCRFLQNIEVNIKIDIEC
jgi:hypothetical protein